jgi:glycosyltransferase involved in cell wall biosynthesis
VAKVSATKQVVHYYPGGDFVPYSEVTDKDLISKGLHAVVTQDFLMDPLRKKVPLHVRSNILSLYGAPYLWKVSRVCIPRPAFMHRQETLQVGFASVGVDKEKGVHLFLDLCHWFLKNRASLPIKFFFVGRLGPDVAVPRNVVVSPMMTQEQLDLYYSSEVDVYVNFETGAGVHGWPLGVEAVLTGAVLVTTDVHDSNSNNKFNFRTYTNYPSSAEIAVFDVPVEVEKVASFLVSLYNDRSLLRSMSVNGQKKACTLFSYENHMNKLFETIDQVVMQNAPSR